MLNGFNIVGHHQLCKKFTDISNLSDLCAMSQPVLKSLRNIGIISHIDAGKTTVSERILFYTGEIHRLGEVHDGQATMDWMVQEQQRGITITATNTSCRWGETWINLIDTPGHIDFTIEVERSLRVLDGAVAIFSAVEGVQPQSESVWHQADRYRVPRISLINKMDRVGANYRRVLAQMTERLEAKPVLLQLPVGEESSFCGVIDLLEERQLTFRDEDLGSTVEASAVPAERAEEVANAREALLEAAADWDDDLLAALLDSKPVTPGQIRNALRKGVLACQLSPVLFASALRNKGIQPLLDAISSLLPSPLDLPPVKAEQVNGNMEPVELACDPKGPLCGLAFKVLSDEGRKLTYLRIYSGTLEAGTTLLNTSQGVQERAARLFRMHAHKRERIDAASAGDIVAITGLKAALTGDTLCGLGKPLRLSGLSIPEPVVSLAIEPKKVQDRDKLILSLDKLQWEDPTFRVREDEDTGQTVLTGMGELHLEVVLRRLSDEFGVEVNAGQPQVVYRESILRQTSHRETFEREIEGKLQRGEVAMTLAPRERGAGNRILIPSEVRESGAPAEIFAVIEETITQALALGVQVGYPMVDLSVRIDDVPYASAVSTALGIRAATQRGLTLAARTAGLLLLEPVMALEIIVPNDCSGKVLGSLQQKGGRVEGMESSQSLDTIRANIPLSAMFGYMTELRSATQGRGLFTMEFSHYDKAPQKVLEKFGL
jgi:elongation factor G